MSGTPTALSPRLFRSGWGYRKSKRRWENLSVLLTPPPQMGSSGLPATSRRPPCARADRERGWPPPRKRISESHRAVQRCRGSFPSYQRFAGFWSRILWCLPEGVQARDGVGEHPSSRRTGRRRPLRKQGLVVRILDGHCRDQ